MRHVFRRAAAVAAVAVLGLATLSRAAVADTVYAVSFSTGELISYQSNAPVGTRTTLSPAGGLVAPAGLAMGPDGNLYIAEAGDGSTLAPRISKFELATLTLSTVATLPFDPSQNPPTGDFPGSIVFQGNDLLIGRNPFYASTGPIVKLTNATGTPALPEDYGDYTTGGNLASSPGLALASDGRLYVSDQTYNFGTQIASGPVKRFGATGTYVGEVIADGASGLAGPTGLAINGNTLYTASIMDGAILQTDLTTDITTPFATTGSTFEAGTLALLSDGGLLVGSPSGFTGNIYQFDTNGTLLSTFASGLGQVGGLVAVAPVPEPGAIAMVASGVVAGAVWLRRRRQAAREARA